MDGLQPSTTTSSASALGTPGRRRNGRLQACEPCRKRKVSCDHATPVCRRCRARNNADGCVYVVPQHAAAPSSRKPTPRRGGNAAGDATRSNDKPHEPAQNGVSSSINATAAAVLDSAEAPALPAETSPGYLGFTSFHQVYQETQNSLSLVQGASILSSMKTPRAPGSSETVHSNKAITLSSRTRETCLTVLRRIPGEDVALALFLKHKNANDGWIRLAARRLVESLHVAFGRELRSRRPADLEEMAQLISGNTARPWSEDEPDAEKWMGSFSGRNMRWECLGIMFMYWSSAAMAEYPHRLEIQTAEEVDPRQFSLTYKEAAQMCIELCKGCAPNSLLLFAMYRNAIMESILAGDASPSFWRLLGDIIATVTYLGLHAIPHDDETYVPTVSSEARRRLVSQIFLIDKVAASFSGRPPLLSRKYMLTPPPLELSDEALLEGGDTLTREVEQLDARGWGHEGKTYYSTTIVRARRMLAVVKDEIMELALGHPIYASVEALIGLKTQAHELFSELPPALRYQPEDVRDMSVAGPTLYVKLLVHLEHFQNLFFVARLLVQRGHNSHADLLSLSFEMVSTTLIFWTHMDRLAGLQGDFEWLVMAYAAPAGGILCNELLNPTLHLTPALGVTKSGIIQQLSLLVGFLDWVSPSAPNGALCTSCKAVIQHILDQALNGLPVNLSNNPGTEPPFDFNYDVGAGMGGFFNFDLLDTFEWLRPDLSSSQQSQPIR